MYTPNPGYPIVQLDNVAVGYKGTPLFNPFSLSLPHATLNLLIGANGTGKSTIMQTIGGLIEPVKGSVRICGRDIKTLNRKQLSTMLSFVYTERFSGGGLTVRELVEMGRYPYTGLFGRLSTEDVSIVDKAMADVGISHKADDFLSDISDGERQKAMIARVLAQQTPLLMLDEPTNFLDAASRIEILKLIEKLVRTSGITAVISTHEVSTAIPLADNVITILPKEDLPVNCTPTHSQETIERLNGIFADRNVVFDPEKGDFVPICFFNR